MKWSLNTYKTAQDWELDYLIEMAKKTGYHGIEFLMDYNQRHGLEFASLTSCQVFHHPTEEERRKSVERVKRVIDMAHFFGCKHVRVLGDRFTSENRDEVIRNVGSCLRELGEYAEEYGITVSIEMHGSFTDPDPALEVISIADRPNVGLVFNCVWPNVTIETVDEFHDRIMPYVTMVHAHRVEDPATFEFYRRMFAKLKERGFDGYISNESAYTGPDPEKVLAMYVALYRALSGE